MARHLSEWGLRQEAERCGFPVTHKQFKAYLEAGLLPESVDGRWPVEVVDRLMRIRDAKKEVRPLARRVILLRKDYSCFPVASPKVKEAMTEMLLSIAAPKRKMKQVDAAIKKWLTDQMSGRDSRIDKGQRPPEPDKWKAILEDTAEEVFAERLWYSYHFEGLLRLEKRRSYDLSNIPFEERIVLLIIRDLAYRQADLRGQKE